MPRERGRARLWPPTKPSCPVPFRAPSLPISHPQPPSSARMCRVSRGVWSAVGEGITQEGPSICPVPREALLPTTRPPGVCAGAHLDSSPCPMNEQVTLSKLLYSSVPQFPPLQRSLIMASIICVCMRSKGNNMCMVFKAPLGMRLMLHKCSKTLLGLMVTVAEAPCSRPQSLHLPIHHPSQHWPGSQHRAAPNPGSASDHGYATPPLQTSPLTSM